jgi:hypothetical protein
MEGDMYTCTYVIQGRCCDCATAQGSGQSAIENSGPPTRAIATRSRDRLWQKIPLNHNG